MNNRRKQQITAGQQRVPRSGTPQGAHHLRPSRHRHRDSPVRPSRGRGWARSTSKLRIKITRSRSHAPPPRTRPVHHSVHPPAGRGTVDTHSADGAMATVEGGSPIAVAAWCADPGPGRPRPHPGPRVGCYTACDDSTRSGPGGSHHRCAMGRCLDRSSPQSIPSTLESLRASRRRPGEARRLLHCRPIPSQAQPRCGRDRLAVECPPSEH
jgi:hypothetical protein